MKKYRLKQSICPVGMEKQSYPKGAVIESTKDHIFIKIPFTDKNFFEVVEEPVEYTVTITSSRYQDDYFKFILEDILRMNHIEGSVTLVNKSKSDKKFKSNWIEKFHESYEPIDIREEMAKIDPQAARNNFVSQWTLKRWLERRFDFKPSASILVAKFIFKYFEDLSGVDNSL